MKLNFKTFGQDYPLVLVHGLFGMSDNLTVFAKLLAAEGYKVYLTDLRNHGHSPHDPMHNYPVMAKDLAELVKDEKLERPVVIGHSMGGKAAMQFANDYPDLLSALVVIDIAPYYYPVHHRLIIDALNSVDLDTTNTRNEADEILKKSIDDYGTRQFLLKNLHWKNEKLAWRFNLKAIDQQIEDIGQATWPESINTVPVCFISGAKSDYIDPAREEEISEKYVNANFVSIHGAGHWVHADKPEELTNAVVDFLRSVIF